MTRLAAEGGGEEGGAAEQDLGRKDNSDKLQGRSATSDYCGEGRQRGRTGNVAAGSLVGEVFHARGVRRGRGGAQGTMLCASGWKCGQRREGGGCR